MFSLFSHNSIDSFCYEQHFNLYFEFPVVIASIIDNKNGALPVKLYRGGLSMTKDSRMTFYDQQDTNSIKEILVGLININLELISKD